jgi:hypothetical protein
VKTTGADTTTIDFIEPMYALAVQNISKGKEWLYEVKFDGYRCLAGRNKTGVILWSRRGNLFTSQFPHIASACERLPADTLFDGEIVAVDKSGRITRVKIGLSDDARIKAYATITLDDCFIIHGLRLGYSLATQVPAIIDAFQSE